MIVLRSPERRGTPKPTEGGPLSRFSSQDPTKGQYFLHRLHELHSNLIIRPAFSQDRTWLGHLALETKRLWRSRPACGRSRQSEAVLPPTSRLGTVRAKGR